MNFVKDADKECEIIPLISTFIDDYYYNESLDTTFVKSYTEKFNTLGWDVFHSDSEYSDDSWGFVKSSLNTFFSLHKTEEGYFAKVFVYEPAGTDNNIFKEVLELSGIKTAKTSATIIIYIRSIKMSKYLVIDKRTDALYFMDSIYDSVENSNNSLFSVMDEKANFAVYDLEHRDLFDPYTQEWDKIEIEGYPSISLTEESEEEKIDKTQKARYNIIVKYINASRENLVYRCLDYAETDMFVHLRVNIGGSDTSISVNKSQILEMHIQNL